MSSLTHWVLAQALCRSRLDRAGDRRYRRSGSGLEGAEWEFSVTGKEGWKTTVAIADRYGSKRNGGTPLMPVVTLAEGDTRRSPGPEFRPN